MTNKKINNKNKTVLHLTFNIKFEIIFNVSSTPKFTQFTNLRVLVIKLLHQKSIY